VGNSGCDVINKERTTPALVQIGTATAIPYSFCGDVFSHWLGTTTENATDPNYLGILAIGWCYILSARLVEMQGDSAIMRYTSSYAGCLGESLYNPSEETHIIDVGEAYANAQVVRWWSAILAKRGGWKAIVKDDPGNKFFAPWTVSRTCETSFIIKQGKDSPTSVQTPLSSDAAFDALLEFARLHGLGSQFPIALAIAMSFPMHRYYGTEVKLPLPSTHGGETPSSVPGDTPPAWAKLKEELPYYMTLSCSPEIMISTLCGSFWQPDVPCNMVSQWLHPLEEVLGNTTDSKDQELIALMGAIRRPSVSALWIGAAASGMVPKLLHYVRRGRPPLDSVGFSWTGAPQSFMDDTGSGPYTCEDPRYVSRPDVWRLLHLPPTEEDDLSYEYRPLTPWEPCGASLATDCALRVTSHLNCSRHEYQYDHWNWELENGQTILDYGYSRRSPSLITEELFNIPDIEGVSHSFQKRDLDPDREASELASMDIFRWFILGGEGVPSEKIYENDLLREIWEQEDDGDEELDEADDRDLQKRVFENKGRVETWLDTID